MKSLPSKSLLSCAIVLALLQGCGGGGGGGSADSSTPSSGNSSAPSNSSALNSGTTTQAPSAPVASVAFAVKQLQFSWAAIAGATFYRVLEDASGSGNYQQVGGDLTAQTFNLDIALHTLTARYQVQACNSAGCATSSTLSAIEYFKASNTGSGDTFGWSLALSDDGNTLAVGAPSEDGSGNSSTDSGAVYVFANSSTGWTQQAYLKTTTVLAGANFGESVALSSDGNTLVAGAPLEDSNAGSIYVFTRSSGSWTQKTRVKASNAYANSYFGWSVSLSDSGLTLAVGAPGESNNGTSVTTNPHSVGNAGAAYVFTLNAAGAASNQIYLKASTIAADDNFGATIAISGSGSVLAVGSPNKSSGAGAAYVYTYSSSSWGTPYIATSSASASNFSAAITLDTAGNTLAVGAPYEAANVGAAYVFTRSNNASSWSQSAYLKASITHADDDFGSALTLSGDGNSLAIGAIGESSKATGASATADSDTSKNGVGAVYVFKRSSNTWAQQNYVKPSVATLGDEFGTAIGLNTDGSTLAISGAFEQSNATGIGGTQSDTSAVDAGAVWLF